MKVFAAIFLPLTIAYATALAWCAEMWWLPEGYYSHGLLVPPLMAVLLYLERRQWAAVPSQPDPRGWYLLGPALLLHLGGAALTIDSLSAGSLLLAAPGAVWLAFGPRRLRKLAPVLGLLLFAVPLPIFVTGRIAFQLKETAVDAGLAIANWFGLGAVRDVALVKVPGQTEGLLVAEACGGLRSLLAMLTLAWCIAFFTGPRGWVRRFGLMLVAGPLAVLVNALRIAGLCWSARWYGTAFATGWGHDVCNVIAWALDLSLLVGCDAVLRRLPRTPALPALPAVPYATASQHRLRTGAVVLWCACGPLLALSLYRPFRESAGWAEAMPADVYGFHLAERLVLLSRYRELLGTSDASWRRYESTGNQSVWVIAVFHESNWKSVHPPDICIEGSNMDIVAADTVPIGAPGGAATAGRIVAQERSSGRTYVSLFAYGARGFCTGSYWSFFRYHAPRALLRRSNAGFLLRVEAFAGSDGTGPAEALCRRLLEALLPAAEGLLPP